MTETKNNVIIIIVANILSQGFLLIATGTFWDDWMYYYRDRTGLWKEFMEAGRPSSAFWVETVWNLPHYGYRWLVFLLFMITALILYALIRNSKMFNQNEALWLSVLYTVMPVNDARIILCTFSYAVGLTSFMIGVYVLQKYMLYEKSSRFHFRIAALFFFGYSFIIQSLLVFYAAVLFYIFFCEYQNRRKVLEAIKAMVKYVDFIALPIIFWVGKQIVFPSYGSFANYNVVTMGTMVKAACRLPLAALRQLERNWIGIFDFLISGDIVIICTIPIVMVAVIRIGIWLKKQINQGAVMCLCVGERGGEGGGGEY